jgi:hypothetical protein
MEKILMNKYEYIIAENVSEAASKEIDLWRAVVIQHLIDLSSNVDKKSRCAGFRRAAFYWIFGRDQDYDTIVNMEKELIEIDYKTNSHFREVCELSHLNAESVMKQAIAILKNKTTKAI